MNQESHILAHKMVRELGLPSEWIEILQCEEPFALPEDIDLKLEEAMLLRANNLQYFQAYPNAIVFTLSDHTEITFPRRSIFAEEPNTTTASIAKCWFKFLHLFNKH